MATVIKGDPDLDESRQDQHWRVTLRNPNNQAVWVGYSHLGAGGKAGDTYVYHPGNCMLGPGESILARVGADDRGYFLGWPRNAEGSRPKEPL